MVDDFEYLSSKMEYKNSWYSAGYDLLRQPNGTEKKYYWVDMPNAVTIVPIIDDSIVMVREYRPVTGNTYISCPTGIVEDGESYKKTAKRELVEETNYEASELTHIQSFDVATGVLKHERGVVVAQELEKKNLEKQYGENNEFIEPIKVNTNNIISKIREKPSNSASVEAILLAKEDGYI